MRSSTIAIFLLLFAGCFQLKGQQKAHTVSFCGMTLQFDEAAHQRLQEEVKRLKASPRYFNQMVKRAQIYMPLIEPALEKAGVPSDLKYLAIQESSLRPNVESSSQAVGIWQMKEATAKETGLQIDEQVDERRHVIRATEGAAIYLSKANYVFDNWVYATIAYYEGYTGAVPHTLPKYYAKQFMIIDTSLHWYVMRAIAHKVAYEPSLQSAPASDLSLQAHPIQSELRLEKLVAQHNITLEQFQSYNPWARNEKRLPRDYTGVYIVPVRTLPQPPVASTPAPAPQPTPTVPTRSRPVANLNLGVALDHDQLKESQYVEFQVKRDLHYGTQYLYFDGSKSLADLAMAYGHRYSDLLRWNDLMPGERPPLGKIVYLQKPSKAAYHVVEPGETLFYIAEKHHMSTRKIQKKNNMKRDEMSIYVGQKLYLDLQKPTSEKVIILKPFVIESQAEVQQTASEEKPTKERNVKPQPSAEVAANSQSQVPPKPRWIDHEVQAGETLWAIAQRYGSRVEVIMRANDLTTEFIREGQTLRVLARK